MLKHLSVFRHASAAMAHSGHRQSVIADNVANADTPEFKARDVTPFSFETMARRAATAPRATRPGHFQPVAHVGHRLPAAERVAGYEETPDGNTVDLEEQMVKAAEVQRHYALATDLYKKHLQFLRIAVSKPR